MVDLLAAAKALLLTSLARDPGPAGRPRRRRRVKRLLPQRADYRGLARSWRGDVVAGLTVAVVALPLALAFGITTGLGAAAGLTTAIVAGLVAGFLGGSDVQVSGPTGAMTVVLVPLVARHGADAVVIVGALAGILVLAAGVFRTGPLPRLHALARHRGLHARHRRDHLPAAGARRPRRRAPRGREHRRGRPPRPGRGLQRRDLGGLGAGSARRRRDGGDPPPPPLAAGIPAGGGRSPPWSSRSRASTWRPSEPCPPPCRSSSCRRWTSAPSRATSARPSPSPPWRRSRACCRRRWPTAWSTAGPTILTVSCSAKGWPTSCRPCSGACPPPGRSPGQR